jgi:dihydroneopterin aldolase
MALPRLASLDADAIKVPEDVTLATDIVYLRDLQLHVVIGIYDWERRIRQRLLLNLDMATDIRPAAAADDIELTLNYKAVAKRVTAFAYDSECLLVETLAERLAALIMDEFGVPWVRVSLNKKGAVTGATDVGVIIERGNRK